MLQDKALELGRLIGQSEEYKAVMRANATLGEDSDAVALLKQMEKLRQDAQAMLSRGEEPTAEMEQQLDGMLSQIQTNASYQRVAVAQENLDKVMQRVNNWISEGITKGAQSPIITLG